MAAGKNSFSFYAYSVGKQVRYLNTADFFGGLLGRQNDHITAEAKQHLTKIILNKTAYIQGYGLGPSNPVLGVIYLDGININLEMVRAGLAVAYRGRPPEGFDSTPYLEAEKQAREARRGCGV